jgi:hypothetical protein
MLDSVMVNSVWSDAGSTPEGGLLVTVSLRMPANGQNLHNWPVFAVESGAIPMPESRM